MRHKKRILSIEPHGDGYAIYSGRDQEHHGFRLCNVNDFDMSKERTIRTLKAGLLALELIFDYIDSCEIDGNISSTNEMDKLVNQVANTYFGTGE